MIRCIIELDYILKPIIELIYDAPEPKLNETIESRLSLHHSLRGVTHMYAVRTTLLPVNQ